MIRFDSSLFINCSYRLSSFASHDFLLESFLQNFIGWMPLLIIDIVLHVATTLYYYEVK
jgi:hypothetical protein